MIEIIDMKAITMLRDWYYWTREATCKSTYPAVTHVWEKHGFAWVHTAVGFDLSKGTKKFETKKWEEAGHQFLKLPDKAQSIILGYLFHNVDVKHLSELFRTPKSRIRAIIISGLREYETNCINSGIIEERGEMNRYLSGRKEIAKYLNLSEKTLDRYHNNSGTKLPIAQVRPNGLVIARTSDLDEWHKRNVAKL